MTDSVEEPSPISAYARSLRGRWQEAYLRIKSEKPATIISDCFYIGHARILALIESEESHGRELGILMAACQVLVEQEQLSPDFVDEVRLRMHRLNTLEMLQQFQMTLGLAEGSDRLFNGGNQSRQLEICKSLMLNIMRNSPCEIARGLVVATIQQLKLDAGLNSEELEQMIGAMKVSPDSEEPEESEELWDDED